jgi:cation-transporting ATPase 13A2
LKDFILPPLTNFEEIDSLDLVPGDIFALENGQKIPCDTLLFDGELLLNEAALTGEYLPIIKRKLERNSNKFFSY